MVPYWVREPIGRPRPFLMSSTPAITVVLTAPIPGRSTPSFPRAGAIITCPCSIRTLLWSIGRYHHNTSGETASQERPMIEQVTQVCKQTLSGYILVPWVLEQYSLQLLPCPGR